MTTRNRSGRPSGGRLPNDPLDWVAESPPAEEPAPEGAEQVKDAPENSGSDTQREE